MLKNLSGFIFLLSVSVFLAAGCSGPEEKIAGYYDDMASIAESNKEDCGNMGDKLKEFVEDSKKDYKSILKEVKTAAKENKKVCEGDKFKSSECEDFNKENWGKADIAMKRIVSETKLNYYMSWCSSEEKVSAAMKNWDEISVEVYNEMNKK